jgi:hypothetical protein
MPEYFFRFFHDTVLSIRFPKLSISWVPNTVKKIDSNCTGDPVWSPAAESSGLFLAPFRSA